MFPRAGAGVTENRSPWLTVPQAAARSHHGRAMILAALADESLRGHQPKPKAHWRIHVDDLDAWVRGEPAPVQFHTARRTA